MKDETKGKIKMNALSLIAVGPLIVGGNLFLYFMDKIPGGYGKAGTFDYLYINLAMIGGVLFSHFFIKWRIKKKGNVPIADERTLLVMKNYLLWVLAAIFFVSAIILLVLFFLGVETIEIGWIFVYLSGLIILSMLGALIASKA